MKLDPDRKRAREGRDELSKDGCYIGNNVYSVYYIVYSGSSFDIDGHF